jgi:hypothetical protein
LIDPNENLAIFDNGNLYAKNAWIEGHIRATDGTFTGNIEAKSGSIGNVNIENGGLKAKSGAFELTRDGTLIAQNGKFSGVLETTTFSAAHTQAVGGGMIVRPTLTIADGELINTSNNEKSFNSLINDFINCFVTEEQNETIDTNIIADSISLYKISVPKVEYDVISSDFSKGTYGLFSVNSMGNYKCGIIEIIEG